MTSAGLCTKQGDAIPLKGVEVEGEVLGAHARVKVRQRYCNESRRALEAVYTFPLPADATLTAFSMTCDGRRFEGIVKEREAAFRAYDDALVAGHGAALLEQERTNVFTASVGNLLPGEETLVEVEYVQRVAADEGALRWMIPTLVAPRYIPGTPTGDRTAHGESAPTDRVPDADRITPPRVAEVPYGLRLDLTFDLGRAVTVESPSHAITAVSEGARTRVRFAQESVALDRDVVLTARGPSVGPKQGTGVVAHRVAGKEGYLALSVVPDLFGEDGGAAAPSTVVFVVDVSGSMAGASIIEAKRALRLCLRHLRAGDRFNVIAFSNSHWSFAKGVREFTQEALAQADQWIESLNPNGGTEMLAPLTDAIALAEGGVVVLLTDGEVGNEDEITQAVMKRRGESRSRVYSFGIGTNVSEGLLRDLARETGGAVEFIHPGERIDEKVVAQFARAVAPRVTDVSVRFVGADVGELAPGRVPDLVDGEPWSVLGRYARGGGGTVEIDGRFRGRAFAIRVPLDLPEEVSRPVVAKLWAAERIRDLEGAKVEGRRGEAMKARITELAVEHGIASRFTSFVVVEQRTGDRRTSGMPETALVPVGLPAGWAMFEREKEEASRSRGGPPPLRQMAAMTPAGAMKKRASRPAAAMPSLGRVASMAPGAPPPPPAAPAPAPMAAMPAPKGRAMDQMESESLDDDFDDMQVAVADGASYAPAEPAADELFRAERSPKAKKEARGAIDLGALFGRQLASGLWDDASLGADGDARRLRATVAVLRALLAQGVDTAHALYGAQVRKALEAVVAVVAAVGAREKELAERALGLAWLLATGARTKSAVEGAVTAAGFTELGARLKEPAKLREWAVAGA